MGNFAMVGVNTSQGSVVMASAEMSLEGGIVFGVVIFLIIVAEIEIHEYDFFKVLLTGIAIIFFMILVVFIALMFVILLKQFYSFIVSRITQSIYYIKKVYSVNQIDSYFLFSV